MTRTAILIDLACARPPSATPSSQWPPLAREHATQVMACIHRLLAHGDTTSVTLHTFDSACPTASHPPPITHPLSAALDALSARLPAAFKRLNVATPRLPCAAGVLAGLCDGLGEDNSFDSFYPDRKPPPSAIFLFSRAPASVDTLAAFVGMQETELPPLEVALRESRPFRNKLMALANQAIPLVWVNCSLRRADSPGCADSRVERIFKTWFLSHSLRFRFAGMHSLLLDRRIVPARAVVDALQDGKLGNVGGHQVSVADVMFRAGNELLRYFRASVCDLSLMDGAFAVSNVVLLLRGFVRSVEHGTLVCMGAFDTPARLFTPISDQGNVSEERQAIWASYFSGLMVDLARRNLSLVAEVLETNEDARSFSKYSAIIDPITPLCATLRRISEEAAKLLPQGDGTPNSFAEYEMWPQIRSAKNCEMVQPASGVTAKFFETFLSGVFQRPLSTENKGPSEGEDPVFTFLSKDEAPQTLEVALSFENLHSPPHTKGHEALVQVVQSIMKTTGDDSTKLDTHNSQLARGDAILRKLQARASAKPSSKSTRRSAGPCFKWRPTSKVIAPRRDEITVLIEDGKPAPMRNESVPVLQVESEHVEKAQGPKGTGGDFKKPRERCLSTLRGETPMRDVSQLPHPPNTCVHSDACHEYTRAPIDQQGAVPSRYQIPNRSKCLLPDTDGSLRSTEMVPNKDASAALHISQDLPLRVGAGAMETEGTLSTWSRQQKALERDPQLDYARLIKDAAEDFKANVETLKFGSEQGMKSHLHDCLASLSGLAKLLAAPPETQAAVRKIAILHRAERSDVSAALQDAQTLVQTEQKTATGNTAGQLWPPIMNAFAQVIWHLAGDTAKELSRKRTRSSPRSVAHAETILSCTQFVGNCATSNRPAANFFREVFSCFFSTVLVHFLHILKSDYPATAVLSLYEQFEQPLPKTREPQSRTAEPNPYTSVSLEQRGVVHCEDSREVSNPSETFSAQSDRKRRLQSQQLLGERNSKKRPRSSRKDPKRLIAEARTIRTGKPDVGRAQFAMQSETVIHARRTQRRLAVQSTASRKRLRTVASDCKKKQEGTRRVARSLANDFLRATSVDPGYDTYRDEHKLPPIDPAPEGVEEVHSDLNNVSSAENEEAQIIASANDQERKLPQRAGQGVHDEKDQPARDSRTRSPDDNEPSVLERDDPDSCHEGQPSDFFPPLERLSGRLTGVPPPGRASLSLKGYASRSNTEQLVAAMKPRLQRMTAKVLRQMSIVSGATADTPRRFTRSQVPRVGQSHAQMYVQKHTQNQARGQAKVADRNLLQLRGRCVSRPARIKKAMEDPSFSELALQSPLSPTAAREPISPIFRERLKESQTIAEARSGTPSLSSPRVTLKTPVEFVPETPASSRRATMKTRQMEHKSTGKNSACRKLFGT